MFDPYDSPLMLPPSDGYYEPEASPEPDRLDDALCTVTFYLSWRHISVVKAVKLDLADLSAQASFVILMTG